MDRTSSLTAEVMVLTGLYPGAVVHCQLQMRDFNQEIVVALVVKPPQTPRPGTLLPVILQSAEITPDIKSRLHRRHETQQLTTFLLDGYEFKGKVVQLGYHQEPVCDRLDPAEILTFVISCLDD